MPAQTSSRLSAVSRELSGSTILKIFAEVRALAAAGADVVNLTVGDFCSASRVPDSAAAPRWNSRCAPGGRVNYPPASGVDALRAAIQRLYQRSFGTIYPIESILVTAGSRPPIYSLFRSVVDKGDAVVFGVPSWNNEFYCQLNGARAVPVACDASTNFLPTATMLAPHLRGARLLALNSPLNPTGTVFQPEVLGEICDAVIEENGRRGAGERPLFMMYDQVYWMITVGGAAHADPLSLRPGIAPYLVSVDGISKAFASTGLRVGWALGPPDIIRAMTDVVAHTGAWAPRPEQIGTARFLCNAPAVDAYVAGMRRDAGARLDALAKGLLAMRASGLPVDCVAPQGAIYVSAQFDLVGKRTPDGDRLETNEHIRSYLLHAAGCAMVPFQAFGTSGETGWFRISIGIVSVAQIEALLPRPRAAVSALS